MSAITNCAKDSLLIVMDAFLGTLIVPVPDNWSANIRTRPAAALTRPIVTVSTSGVMATMVPSPILAARPCAKRSASIRVT